MLRIALIGLLCLPALALAEVIGFESTNYLIVSDLERNDTKEVVVRLEKVLAQFRSDFSFVKTKVRNEQKRKAAVFRDRTSYLRATGGATKPPALYSPSQRTLFVNLDNAGDWESLAHEAFHQFAYEDLGGNWPALWNEGTATYYGFSTFTGDSYLTGRIPKYTTNTRGEMFRGKIVSFEKLFNMTQAEWNHHYVWELYHQSWSIVHFMLHSDEKYRIAYRELIQAIVDGDDLPGAWRKAIRGDEKAFLNAWATYWQKIKADNEVEHQQRAVALIAVSGIARVNASYGKQVNDLDAFFKNCQSNQFALKDTQEIWLPALMFMEAASKRERQAQWALAYDGQGKPVVRVRFRSGQTFEARYDRAPGEPRTLLLEITAPN